MITLLTTLLSGAVGASTPPVGDVPVSTDPTAEIANAATWTSPRVRSDFRTEVRQALAAIAPHIGNRAGNNGQSHSAWDQVLQRIRDTKGGDELTALGQCLTGSLGATNFLTQEPRIAAAYFAACARDECVGQVLLVEHAVTSDDPTRSLAIDALPTPISTNAEARIASFIAGDRELYVNRAASLASAHASAALIPTLISAQYAPPRKPRGDEGWIAIGKSVNYVANQIPVTGDASGAFQPVVGTIFEGSVLRIMESVVEIHRTEVQFSLAQVIERETGLPAPAFGTDIARWQRWYEREYPALAAAHAAEVARAAVRASTKTQGALDDS